jgi:hypothetical protein
MLERLVNLIPPALSGEANQDSEPNLAVNPTKPTDIVATAFTPDPLRGANAPIYVSNDGGATWSLRNVVPGNGPFGTGDISVGFAGPSGILYCGILSANAPGNSTRMQILRTSNFLSTTTMPVLVDRLDVDQPWVVAGTVTVSGQVRDRVYVGSNDFGGPNGRTATVDVSLDAATAAAPAGFSAQRIEKGVTLGQDGPPIRLALHPDGTIYATHQRWTRASGNTIRMDIVVTRDDAWASSTNPFGALADTDGTVGKRVVKNKITVWNATLGQERLGADAAIAVDPSNSSIVYVAWGDRSTVSAPWTIHVRRSTDRGVTWSAADVRKVAKGKNPCLAVNADGVVGFLCQQVTGTGTTARWVTTFETTTDAWKTAVTPTVLHTALANQLTPSFLPYLGDYARVVTVGKDFYGVFSGSNHPDKANFPNDVTYQRRVDWVNKTLLDLDGITHVPDSIDPFFFHWTV